VWLLAYVTGLVNQGLLLQNEYLDSEHTALLPCVDFFTVGVLTWCGVATYYILFFVQLETRRITLAGVTRLPTVDWMLQM